MKTLTTVSDVEVEKSNNDLAGLEEEGKKTDTLVDDRSVEEAKKDEDSTDDELYNIKNFTI
jgi:hypothetical protein